MEAQRYAQFLAVYTADGDVGYQGTGHWLSGGLLANHLISTGFSDGR